MSTPEQKATARRLARLAVQPDFFVEALKGEGARSFAVERALPDDATLAWVYAEPILHRPEPAHLLWLVIESASFKPVAEGHEIPELPVPICRTVR